MATFAEGVESIRLACSLVLMIPAIGIVLLRRRRAALVAVWLVVAIIVAWLRFTGWWSLSIAGPTHIAAGLVLVGLAVAATRSTSGTLDIAVTALTALVAVWTWVPCVGRQLGSILNQADTAPWSQLAPTAAFMLGHFLPLVLIAALAEAVPELADRVDRPGVRRAGVAIVGFVGLAVATTLLDDVAGELARRSSF